MKYKLHRKKIAGYLINIAKDIETNANDLLAPAEPITFKKLKKRLFKDPKVKEEYEKLKNTPDPIKECNCDCHEFGEVVHGGVCECGVKPESTTDAYKRRFPTPELKEIAPLKPEKTFTWLDGTKINRYSVTDAGDKINECMDRINTLLKLMKK